MLLFVRMPKETLLLLLLKNFGKLLLFRHILKHSAFLFIVIELRHYATTISISGIKSALKPKTKSL